jgi:hypothetical protein
MKYSGVIFDEKLTFINNSMYIYVSITLASARCATWWADRPSPVFPRPNIRGLPTAQPERQSGDRAKNRGRTTLFLRVPM